MAILKTRCPECNAGLKSPTGFAVGQTVCCPKCETYFSVEEPEEEAEDGTAKKGSTTASKGKTKDAPTAKKPLKAAAADDEDEPDDEDDTAKKKKKKKKASYDEDEEPTRSYKNSPLRFAVLGVLIVIMLVLGYFLYEKRKREREDTVSAPTAGSTDPTPAPLPQQKFPKGGGKQPNVPIGGGGPAIGFGGVLGGGPALPPAELQKRTDAFKAKLVGTWVADLGGGATEELTYKADGTFTTKQTGPKEGALAGKYTIKELVGTKGVKIQQDTAGATRTVTAIFEDDELQHPTLEVGVTGTFRKKM